MKDIGCVPPGASMVSSTVEFARYDRLLIEDKAQVLADRTASKSAGQVVAETGTAEKIEIAQTDCTTQLCGPSG